MEPCCVDHRTVSSNFMLWNSFFPILLKILTIFFHTLLHYIIITRSLIARYMELVQPIWHRTHFKKSCIFVVIPFTWLFGVAIIGSHHLSTTKVTRQYSSNMRANRFHSVEIVFVLTERKNENKLPSVRR